MERRELFQNLCSLLNEEIKLYEQMIIDMKSKQNAIINGNIEYMKTAVQTERLASQHVMNQVRKRIEKTDTIKSIIGLNSDKTTLKELIPYADTDIAIDLENFRYRLKSNVHQISKINRENKHLLSVAIDNVHGMVSLFLKDDTTKDVRYEESGLITKSSDDHRVLDFQI